MFNKKVHEYGDDSYLKPRDFIVIRASNMQPCVINDIELRVTEQNKSEYLVDTNGKIISFTNENYAKQFVGKLRKGQI